MHKKLLIAIKLANISIELNKDCYIYNKFKIFI